MRRPPLPVVAAALWLALVNSWPLLEAIATDAFAAYTNRQWAQQIGGWFELGLIISGLVLMQRWAVLLLALDVVVFSLRSLTQHLNAEVMISSFSSYAIVAVLVVPYWAKMSWTLENNKGGGGAA